MATYPLSVLRIDTTCETSVRQFVRQAACLFAAILLFTSIVLGQAALPTKFDDISKRASEAWNSNQFEEAARLYRQSVSLKPAWAEGWGYLAASLYELKRYPEARDAYRRTTVLTPKNGPSWAFTGLCEYELRDYRHAFTDLSKAEQLGLGADLSLQSRVKYRLALLWITAGQFELGLKEIAWFADQNDPNPDAVQATGLSVLRMPLFPYEIPADKRDLVMKAGQAGWAMNSHRLEESRKLYDELANAYPTEPNVHYAYGFLLAFLDQEEAVKQFEKELDLTPSHVPSMVQAAFLYLKMGQLDPSRELARRAMKLDPKNYAPHNILGRILVEEKKYASGIVELETAGKLAPGHPGNHFNLAQAYQRAGRKADAAREFAAFEKLNRVDGNQDASSAAKP
jgi:tetratricopeptide (TPR) repeat protein